MAHLFEQTLLYVTKAHLGQVDKGGRPYIMHLLAVSERMERTEEKVVALLHDIVEDTACTLTQLTTFGFSDEIVQAVDALTRRSDEIYMTYIERLSKNPLALTVKIEDLKQNMDLSRLHIVTKRDLSRNKRYQKALDYLIASKEKSA